MLLNIAARTFLCPHLFVVEHDGLDHVLQRGGTPHEVQEVQCKPEGVVQETQDTGHKGEGTEQQGLWEQGTGPSDE